MEQTTTTALDWFTLAIAVAGFVIAFVALIWNIVEWWLGGHRVKVETSVGLVSLGNSVEPVISVTARNVGRSAVTIESWSFVTPAPDAQVMQWVAWMDWQGPLTPYRLEHGTSVEWVVPATQAHDLLKKHNLKPTTQARGRVRLATAESIEAEDAVPVPSKPDDKIANR